MIPPYPPGYGDRQRGVEEVVERLESTLEDLREQINARFDEKLEELNAAEKSALKTRTAYNRAVEDYLKSSRRAANAIHRSRKARLIPSSASMPTTSRTHRRFCPPRIFRRRGPDLPTARPRR
jgi:hypothetical protein